MLLEFSPFNNSAQHLFVSIKCTPILFTLTIANELALEVRDSHEYSTCNDFSHNLDC